MNTASFFNFDPANQHISTWHLAQKIVCFGIICAAYTAILPIGFYGQVDSGLDPSWQLSLHMAFKQGLIFGRDFAFTYGPLGFLSTRLPFDGVRIWLIFSDILLFGSFAAMFASAFLRTNSIKEAFLIFLSALSMGGLLYFMDLAISYFLATIYYLFLYMQRRSYIALALAIFISVLNFYIKLNMGLISIVLVIPVILHVALRAKSWLLALLPLSAHLALIALSAYLLPVDFASYLETSWHIANGYNDAMFVEPGADRHYLHSAILVVAIFVGIGMLNLRAILNDRQIFLQFLIISLFAYLIFKQSFVRADGHIFIFFHFISTGFGLLYLFSTSSMQAKLRPLVLVAIFFSFGASNSRLDLQDYFTRLRDFKNYLATAYNGTPAVPLEQRRSVAAHLPSSFLARIKNNPVDIIPWDISYIFDHNLNYSPRPIMQSYSAYDSFLDGLNSAKYSGSSAPTFLIYLHKCIDDRYCFFDETRTKLAIKTHYKLVAREGDLLLLKRRRTPLTLIEEELSPIASILHQKIKMSDSNELTLMNIEANLNWIGKLRRIFFQPPKIEIVFRLTDGSKHVFRAIEPIIRGGVITNPFISNIDQAEKFFTGKTENLPQVRSIEFRSSLAYALKPEILIKRSVLRNKPKRQNDERDKEE
ncbi:MAG: hypothetical protein KDD42_04460 [Bdellovibrionales bacterium]|nr:hypothetical protein [Bdellovibrionales bacterium]